MDSSIDKGGVTAAVKRFVKGFISYLNVSGDLIPQEDAESIIRAGVSFKGAQLLILIFAIFVASLGLNTDSIPVIIGAMLISPSWGLSSALASA